MPLLRLIPIGQAYASEERAKEAAGALFERGFEEEAVSMIAPSMVESSQAWMLEKGASRDGRDASAMLAELVIDVHGASRVPDAHALVYADRLQEGRSLVLVTAPFGEAQRASDALDGVEHVELGTLPVPDHNTWNQAAPLSSWLNLPVLSRGRSRLASRFPELTEPDYLPTKRFMGGLLTDDPTPLSSKLGIRAVGRNEPAPLSSKLGLALLKKDSPAPLSAAVGLPVLEENEPAPLSRKIGMPVLTKDRPADEKYSFGLPLLLRNNPAPLSSLLGLPTIRRKRDG